jgi:hydroxyquinol 1,2-dioxygenase
MTGGRNIILLSDVLGVSMLVDAINNRKPTGASESTVLGPFHVADAPELPMGANICLDQKGDPMLVKGRITGTDGKPIDHAKIDVWQANDEGFYDVQQKGIQPDFNLRGVFRTGADGSYHFRGVKPKYYPIPDDGPVGNCWASSAAIPIGRRICTTSSKPRATRHWSPISSTPTIPTSIPMPSSA